MFNKPNKKLNKTRKSQNSKSPRFSEFTRTIISICLAAILIVAANIIKPIEYPSFETEVLKEYSVHGVDVSAYQGSVDWNTLYEQGVSFAFVKATEGSSHVDVEFENNWNNLYYTPIMHSAYHFMSFETSGEDQANNYINTVPLRENTLPPVVDVEYYGDFITNPPTVEEVHKILTPLLEKLEAHYGVEPILYTNRHVYEVYLEGNYDNKVWIASPDTTAAVTDEKPWEFLQYTFFGKLDGYDGIEDIDLNVYNGTIKELVNYNN